MKDYIIYLLYILKQQNWLTLRLDGEKESPE